MPEIISIPARKQYVCNYIYSGIACCKFVVEQEGQGTVYDINPMSLKELETQRPEVVVSRALKQGCYSGPEGLHGAYIDTITRGT